MKYKPIKYFFAYILGTLAISFWGPAYYVNFNKISVFLYMTVFIMVMAIGYYIGCKFRLIERSSSGSYSSNRVSIMPLLRLAIIVSTTAVIIEALEVLVRNPSALSLANIGKNYIEIRQYLSSTTGYSLGILIRFFTGFFRVLIMTVGLYQYRHLSKRYRAGLITYYVLTIVVNAVIYGTQKMLGDMLIYAAIVGVLKMSELKASQRRRLLRYVVIAGCLFIIYVVINQVQRYESIGVNVFNYGARTVNGIAYNSENIIFKVLGYKYGFGLALLLTGYMTSGYYGLSLCLQLPFVWTYGIGSSYILSMSLEKFFGLSNVYYSTYLHRMETSYGRLGADAWNSIFPWLASDYTFAGAILFFLPVGIIYAISWRETYIYKNPVSLLMFATISLGLIFVPANNQLFLGIDGFISTWIIGIYWSINHSKYNILD